MGKTEYPSYADITTTRLFADTAREARADSRRYWATAGKPVYAVPWWFIPLVDPEDQRTITARSIRHFRKRNRRPEVRP